MAITTTTPTWLFNLISVQVLNVNTQSKLIIPTNQLNDAIGLRDGSILGGMADTKVNLSFYTYERDKVSDLTKALSVKIVGEYVKGDKKEIATYKLKSTGFHPHGMKMGAGEKVQTLSLLSIRKNWKWVEPYLK